MKDVFHRDADKLASLFKGLVERVLVQEVLGGLEDKDLTSAQLASLYFLARHESNVVGDLAAGLGISAPAATKASDRLVAKGLVSRREGERDRRHSKLEVTPEGLVLLESVLEARRERLTDILHRMSPEDQKALLKGLKGFITAAFMTDKELIRSCCENCGSDCFKDCVVNQAHLAFLGSEIHGV